MNVKQIIKVFADQVRFDIQAVAVLHGTEDQGRGDRPVHIIFERKDPSYLFLRIKEHFRAWQGRHPVDAVMRINSSCVVEMVILQEIPVFSGDAVHLIFSPVTRVLKSQCAEKLRSLVAQSQIDTFNVYTFSVLEEIDQPVLVCCIYKPGRSEASAVTVAPQGADDGIVT